MKEKSTTKLIYPMLCSASGMVLGFITFLITGNFIFLIVFITIGLTLGIALSQQKNNLFTETRSKIDESHHNK